MTSYSAGTNGLAYQQIIMPMPALTDAQMDLLPLYSTCVTEMGVGERDYQQTQLWHSAVVGAYSASASVRTDKDSLDKLHGNISFTSKGLARNQAAMTELMQESTAAAARFDELPRLRELVAQIRTYQRIVHYWQWPRAGDDGGGQRSCRPTPTLSQRWGGMTGSGAAQGTGSKPGIRRMGCTQLSGPAGGVSISWFLHQPRQYSAGGRGGTAGGVCHGDRQSGFSSSTGVSDTATGNLINYAP